MITVPMLTLAVYSLLVYFHLTHFSAFSSLDDYHYAYEQVTTLQTSTIVALHKDLGISDIASFSNFLASIKVCAI